MHIDLATSGGRSGPSSKAGWNVCVTSRSSGDRSQISSGKVDSRRARILGAVSGELQAITGHPSAGHFHGVVGIEFHRLGSELGALGDRERAR